jgi:hypothetical protein
MIYFEDLEVGEETYFGSYEVTREEVLEFARKYDPQPFHLSDEEAAKTHFGRIAASGWHTAAMTMAVIARHVVKHEQAGLGSPGIDDLITKQAGNGLVSNTHDRHQSERRSGDDFHVDRAHPTKTGRRQLVVVMAAVLT